MLSDKVIKSLPLVNKGEKRKQYVKWDEALPGFGVVIGQRARTFVVQRDVAGKSVRISLGRLGELTDDDAFAIAGMVIAHLKRLKSPPTGEQTAAIVDSAKAASGVLSLPVQIEPRAKAKATVDDLPPELRITLRDAIEHHIKRQKGKAVSERTAKAMRDEMGRHLADWMDLPLVTINKSMCAKRHEKILESGEYIANRVMGFLRACWNSAFKTVDDVPVNPVGGVTFARIEREREPVTWPRLPKFAAAVNAIKNPVRRDLLWTLLLTGLRSNDARTLRWEFVNLTDDAIAIDVPREGDKAIEVAIPPHSIYLPRPKGGAKRAFSIPVSSAVLAILKRRKADNPQQFGDDAGWVFPSRDRTGNVICVQEPKVQAYYKDENGSQKKKTAIASPHQLRHTFASACHDTGIDPLNTKTLMNHLKPKNDVSMIYKHPSVEFLRRDTERVTAFILDKAKARPDAIGVE